jgi:small subunit ribosomal protein S7
MDVDIKVFGKWSVQGIKVEDQGLERYIQLRPTMVPRTGATYAKAKFHKSRVFIVERLMNKIMIPGHRSRKHKITSYTLTGKAQSAYSITQHTFEIIEAKTKENPIKVFVKALENAAPREEIIAIEYGGARYPKAVDCSPQRRIDVALRHMTQGPQSKSFNSKKGYADALAEEIINCFQLNLSSNAIAKKQEIERQADSSR